MLTPQRGLKLFSNGYLRRESILPLDKHLALVALIDTFDAGGRATEPCRLASATGFFFEHNDRIYLITNRHVVIKEESNYYPDQIVIHFHNLDDKPNVPPFSIPVSLYGARGERSWKEHPADQKFDLIAIDVHDFLESCKVATLNSENIFPIKRSLSLGHELLIIGYPYRFSDATLNLPIVRTGTLATPFGISFDKKPICLVDANLHPGTSGSPVFVKRHSIPLNIPDASKDQPNYLVGVNSAEYSCEGVLLGLHAVWYAGLITDILDNDQECGV